MDLRVLVNAYRHWHGMTKGRNFAHKHNNLTHLTIQNKYASLLTRICIDDSSSVTES